jgi:hypothetical protein
VKVTLVRTLVGWSPVDDESIRVSRRWSPGETAVVDLKKPRNYKSLKRYWKLCEVVLNSSKDFKSKDQVHQFLKIRAGHATVIVAKSTGEVYLLADSIDYDSIEDETEFQEIWRRVVDVVCEDILPGIDRNELEYEVLKLCGLAS